MQRRVFVKNMAAGAATLTLPLMARAGIGAKPKPNIVFVFPDQLRASAMSYAGDSNVIMPNLDRLAKHSINFRNTVSVSPLCTPYRAALMTGRFPTTTGMFLNDLHLPSEALCMPEVFAKAGYDTGYIGKWHLDGHGRSAFIPPARRQGWDFWKAAECHHDNYNSHYYTGDSPQMQRWKGYDVFAQTEAAQRYIRNHAASERPFFLMLSYGPPHPASKDAPQEYQTLYQTADIRVPPNVPADRQDAARDVLHRYYAHCTAIDHAVGELLKTIDEAGIANNTIFVFTSDHGGMLWSHGLYHTWKQVTYSESAHVPFLLRYPSIHGGGGRIIDTPLNTPDILPTLLGLADIKPPRTIEGDDLSALITEGGEIPGRAVLYMSVVPTGTQTDGVAYRAVRTERYTYVRSLDGPWMLFDDREDPHQMNNLVDQETHQGLVLALDKKLQAELVKVGDDFRTPKSYIEQWGYTVNSRNIIPPWTGEHRAQSPGTRVNYSK